MMRAHGPAAQGTPTLNTPPSTPPTPHANRLSDIFSDSPPAFPSLSSSNTEPSDIPRLRSTHSTAGYRAGVSDSKLEALQPGFDEGFSLGASFGLQAGVLIGSLEGLFTGLSKAGSNDTIRMGDMVKGAEKELALEEVFGKEWWGEGGVWKYALRGDESREEGDETEVAFREIVDNHPLIRKWEAIVEHELEVAGIDRRRFEGAKWERGRLETLSSGSVG